MVMMEANGKEISKAPNRLFRLAISLAATTIPPERSTRKRRFCQSIIMPLPGGFVVFVADAVEKRRCEIAKNQPL
jgi:hypothetical protein